jgi:serine/threonine-protein kinase
LTAGSNNQYPTSISPDGTQLIFRENTPNAGAYLRVLSLGPTPADVTASSQRIQSLMQTARRDDNGELSPDGRFLAYQSADAGAGQSEIYVRPFPHYGAGLWVVSTNGGTKPVWARNGQELFFLDANDAMTVVSVQTASSFSAGAPTKLFGGMYYTAAAGRTYDISPDGKKFLMIKNANAGGSAGTPATMVVVLNWLRDVQTRAGQ